MANNNSRTLTANFVADTAAMSFGEILKANLALSAIQAGLLQLCFLDRYRT